MTQGNAETADAGASGLLRIERADRVLTVGLNRPAKRNALNDGIILEIGECFANLPEDIGAVVIHGIGDHFSSGLDLSELTDHDATGGLLHSQMWHRVFDRIQYSRVPVIAALRGAVIGGGLELACSAHIRVAEPSTYFALPEGQRGIFVGGGVYDDVRAGQGSVGDISPVRAQSSGQAVGLHLEFPTGTPGERQRRATARHTVRELI